MMRIKPMVWLHAAATVLLLVLPTPCEGVGATAYFEPDISTTRTTPWPRIPSSPYVGIMGPNCPPPVARVTTASQYSVFGLPGTPYAITPFSDLYVSPTKAVATGTSCRAPDPTTGKQHCLRAFQLTAKAFQSTGLLRAIPGCKNKAATWFLGYNGVFPGPTIVAPKGHEVMVRITNNITAPFFTGTGRMGPDNGKPCINGRTGRPISTHLHGSASLPPYDGWADDETCGGESKDYIYPNQRANTGWYHDHALHLTLDNAYAGIAGFYLISDKQKDGGCGEPYNLENIEERLMMIRDAVLDTSCQLLHDPVDAHQKSLYGDINTVNGVPFPEMPLSPKTYRFRFVNSAVSRPWLLKIKDAWGRDVSQTMCYIIASDGGYRSPAVPWPEEGLQMGVAERYEAVCDFTQYANQKLYLFNGRNGRMFKDVPYFCHSHLLSLLSIGATTVASSTAPKMNPALAPPPPMHMERILTPLDRSAARTMIDQGSFHREFNFGRSDGHWVINGQTWDTAKIAADDVGQNTWELWKVTTGGGWFHPVHVHLVDFFIIQRGDNPLDPAFPAITAAEAANTAKDGLFPFERDVPKDVLYLGPSQVVWVIARFGAHRGNYMFHCHNLVHEDNDMLRAFDMVGGSEMTAANTPVDTNPAHKPAMNAAFTLDAVNKAAASIYNDNPLDSAMAPLEAAHPISYWAKYNSKHFDATLSRNVYKIFYSQTADGPVLSDAAQNPWKAEVCQSLPVQIAL